MQEIPFTVRLFAANGEQLTSELRCPRSRRQDFLNFGFEWSVFGHHVQSQFSVAREDGQKGVGVMSYAARQIPHRIFGEMGDRIESNTLVMKIQPEEGVSIRFNAKVPGPKMHIRAVTMDFNYGTGFGVASAPAYERLVGDAMRGDATLFTRWDAVERAWEIVMPVLEGWTSTRAEDFPNYAAGTQGPSSSDALLAGDGREWRKI